MSMHAAEKPVPQHDSSNAPQQTPPTPSALPGGDAQLARPVVGGLAFPKDATAADILTELATPKTFAGPEIDLQKEIVTKLEGGIVELNKTAQAVSAAEKARVNKQRDDALAVEQGRKKVLDYEKSRWWWSYWRKTDQELASTEKSINDNNQATYDQHAKQTKKVPAEDYSQDVLYLGSIVLTDIPATAEGDDEMIANAELVETDYALSNSNNGAALPKAAQVDKAIVKNTLKTMIAAGQIEYLRRSGIVGDEWQVIVEIHYYRNRSKTQANLHKDTLGQTLFVNLNYTNEAEAPGPEYILNPPTVPSHEEKIAKTLPAAFNQDLAAVRKAKAPASRIENSKIPAHGVVVFVDEAIHHATPLLGHRRVRVANVREWVATDREFLAGTGKDDDVVREVLKLCSDLEKAKDEKDKVLTRPDLRKAGMSDDDIDNMLSDVGPNEWNSVAIPGAARKDASSAREPIREPKENKADPDKPRTRVKRSMSYENLDAFPHDDPAAPRRFFRTWVRAVRKT